MPLASRHRQPVTNHSRAFEPALEPSTSCCHPPPRAAPAPLCSRYQRKQVLLQPLTLLQHQPAKMNPHLFVSVQPHH